MRNNYSKFSFVPLAAAIAASGVISGHEVKAAVSYIPGKIQAESSNSEVILRKKASFGGAKIAALKNATAVRVYVNMNTGWSLIEIPDGRQGYVCTANIKMGDTEVDVPTSSSSASADKKNSSDSTGTKTDTAKTETAKTSTDASKTNTSTNAVIINVDNTSRLNVRKKAKASAKIVTTLKNGTALSVEDQSAEWCKVVTSTGIKGFVSSNYVRHEICKLDVGKVGTTTSNVNIRKKPTKAAVTYCQKGVKLKVLAIYGQWYKVKANGKTGFIYAKYLQ